MTDKPSDDEPPHIAAARARAAEIERFQREIDDEKAKFEAALATVTRWREIWSMSAGDEVPLADSFKLLDADDLATSLAREPQDVDLGFMGRVDFRRTRRVQFDVLSDLRDGRLIARGFRAGERYDRATIIPAVLWQSLVVDFGVSTAKADGISYVGITVKRAPAARAIRRIARPNATRWWEDYKRNCLSNGRAPTVREMRSHAMEAGVSRDQFDRARTESPEPWETRSGRRRT